MRRTVIWTGTHIGWTDHASGCGDSDAASHVGCRRPESFLRSVGWALDVGLYGHPPFDLAMNTPLSAIVSPSRHVANEPETYKYLLYFPGEPGLRQIDIYSSIDENDSCMKYNQSDYLLLDPNRPWVFHENEVDRDALQAILTFKSDPETVVRFCDDRVIIRTRHWTWMTLKEFKVLAASSITIPDADKRLRRKSYPQDDCDLTDTHAPTL